MSSQKKIRRGTCIVECSKGILLVEDKKGLLLLPGGKANPDELRMVAAIRELQEETTLQATVALYLFEHESLSNHHKVFWIDAAGEPQPHDDAIAIHYYLDAPPVGKTLSPATQIIIERFLEFRSKHQTNLAIVRKLVSQH